MAITVEQRTSTAELIVGMFSAAVDGTSSAGSTFTLTTGIVTNAFNRVVSTLTQPAFA